MTSASERLRELEEEIVRGDRPASGRDELVGYLPLIADCIEVLEFSGTQFALTTKPGYEELVRRRHNALTALRDSLEKK